MNDELIEELEKLQFGVYKPLIIYNNSLKKYIVNIVSLSSHNPLTIYYTNIESQREIINIPPIKTLIITHDVNEALATIIKTFSNIIVTDSIDNTDFESILNINWIIEINESIYEIYRVINLATDIEILKLYSKKVKYSELTLYFNKLIINLVKSNFVNGKLINKSIYNKKILDALLNYQIVEEKGKMYLWL